MASKVESAPQISLTDDKTSTTRTLPASWWYSQDTFDLEKRALFSKTWLYTAHASQFKKAGDYYGFNFMGMQFFLIKNKTGQIRAFHNICRHRAYPVIRKQKGSSVVLGCMYHGWSYNTDGQLTKAPQFDNVSDFEKAQNSLYPIHTHVTEQGLVFVNLDNSPKGPTPFEKFYKGLDEQWNEFDFTDYEYSTSYDLEGDFNWKTVMESYMESTTVSDEASTFNSSPKTLTVKTVDPEPTKKPEAKGWFGFGKPAEVEQKIVAKSEEFKGQWTYLWPTSGISCYAPAWYSVRVLPVTPTLSVMQFDIFTKKGLPLAEKKACIEFLQKAEKENMESYVQAQKALNEGVTAEKSHMYLSLVRDMCKEHYAKEQAAGEPINPAKIGNDRGGEETDELEEICKELECKSAKNGPDNELNW